jgi:GAF domain-containing protein
MNRDSLLIASLVELADTLVGDYDVIDVLTVLSHRCVEAVDVDAAGVMLVSPIGELQFIASSSESMKMLEQFQIHANDGPCVDCIRNGLAITSEALNETDGRWPMFAPRALAQGFRAVHCLPMRLRGRTIGALNLFRTHQGSLTDDDVAVARGLADVATIAILQHQSTIDASTSNSQLSNAINSRVVIEQAVGMIRQATSCEKDFAFDRLRAHAANHHEGLTVIAKRIVGKSINADDLDAWTGNRSFLAPGDLASIGA